MKKIAGTIVAIVIILIVLGFSMDTGSVEPPGNALVYLNPSRTIYYPPTRTPAHAGYIPIAYKDAKKMAEPYDPQGFNIDGPPLIIVLLESGGVISGWPSYWAGTNVPVKMVKYESSAGEQ